MRPRRESQRKQECAYFVRTQTKDRKPFFRHERWASLLLSILHHYAESSYQLHAFVMMPDHLHLLITPSESIEKTMQMIKGGFSFEAKRELAYPHEIWQQGFTDHQIRNEEDWRNHLEYIRLNPIRAYLIHDSEPYPHIGFPNPCFPQGLRPIQGASGEVRAEAFTLRNAS